MLTDGYGRSLEYLRAVAPTEPPRWKRILHIVWPMWSVALWNDRQRLERAHHFNPNR